MPLFRIDSADDPRIAPYVDLRNKQLRTRQGRFIAEGDLVVQRLLESRYEVESLLVAESQLGRLQVAEEIPVYCTSRKVVESIAGFRFHRGILGCGMRAALDDWRTCAQPSRPAATVVVCCGVRDPENLGGILRNCAAFGVDLVILGDHSADPLSRRVLRVSMATCLKLNLHVSGDLDHVLALLHEQFGYTCAATVLDETAPPLAEIPRPDRLVLVLGNELAGVGPAILARCQIRVTIPMSLQTDSLNVAVASGIFLYHFNQVARQSDSVCRTQSGSPAAGGERSG